MSRGALLIAVLGVLLVTAAWYFLTIAPANDRIAQAEDELEAAQGEQLRLETQLKRYQRIQENQLLYVEALAAVEAAVPPTPQQAALIDDLSQLELESGVELSGVALSFPQEVEGQDYMAIALTAQIKGQYFEVLGFVYGLEELSRIVVIKSVAISSTENEDGFTILTVAISAETYTSAQIPIEGSSDAAPEEEGDTSTTTTTPGGSSGDVTDTTGGSE